MSLNGGLIGLGAAAMVAFGGLAMITPAWNAVRAQQSEDAATTVAAAGVTLHSVGVAFPGSDRMFPGGAEAEAINNNCLACHSAGMVLSQPALSRSAWQGVVAKMRGQFKAPVADDDVPAIVAYLAGHKGAP